MSGNNTGQEGSQDKGIPETTIQTVPQNLTTIQSIQTVQSIQSVQNAVSSGIQNIQTAQTVTGQAATLVGKSISLELNSKLLMKQSIPSSIGTSSDNSKITTSTFCPVGSTVRIIAPSMLSTIDRQPQPQVQQTAQQTQQIVTSIPSTYHVPRGPAAVANISTPRATVATPLVRAISTGPIPISRTGTRPTSIGSRGSPVIVETSTSRVATTSSSDASTSLTPIDFSKRVTITKTRDTSSPKDNVQCRPNVIVKAVRSTSGTIYDKPSSPIPRTCASTTVSNAQWQPKTTSVVYAQPQRHPVPVVNRAPTRPVATAVYAGQQQPQPQQQQSQQTQPSPASQQPQPRLISPGQVGVGRPVQATVVTATPSRLIAPVLQAQNNSITRLPAPTRPSTPQVVTSIPQVSQPGRAVTQTIQPNQTSRPLGSTPLKHIAVSASVIGAPNRVGTVTSVQTNVGRQLTINTAAGASPGTVSRIVIPQQAIQQQQQQQPPQGAQRVVQTVTPLANFSQVSRVIATTSTNAAANVTRVAQTGPTSVARITGMSLHPLPLTPARATPTPLKVTAQAAGIQTVQLKQPTPTMQSQPQIQQQQQQQPPPQQQQVQQGPSGLQRTISAINNANATATSAVVSQQQHAQVQGQYLHQPHTTYYSIDTSGTYSQYRQTAVQPVRLLVEQGFEEPIGKPNASPRPSILRKREQDNSPIKGSIAKNLVPVLAAMPGASSISSPPGSPKADRDGSGNRSSGSTTVSATSSPGLDEEPEHRIPMNPTVEMSPRKKPRKQQLTGVELTESRYNVEDMQFITEEKIKREVKDEPRDNYNDRKRGHSHSQQDPKPAEATPKARPSIMGDVSWKARLPSSKLNHYRRPTDVRPREERRPTVHELALLPQVMERCEGWKVHHLGTQMDDLADSEHDMSEKLKATLTMLETEVKNKRDDGMEKAVELIKGNVQRSTLISEGMVEARSQLKGLFQHKPHVTNLLKNSSGSKRSQKKRDNNK